MNNSSCVNLRCDRDLAANSVSDLNLMRQNGRNINLSANRDRNIDRIAEYRPKHAREADGTGERTKERLDLCQRAERSNGTGDREQFDLYICDRGGRCYCSGDRLIQDPDPRERR